MVEARKFVTPNERQRKEALGTVGGTYSVKKMLEGAEIHWKPKVPPTEGEWLASQKENGQTFDQFQAKACVKIQQGKRDTICIQPLDLTLSKEFLSNLKMMCQAFFQVNVRFLETLDIETFERDKVKTRASYGGDNIQYNAIDINKAMYGSTY